MHKYFFFFSQFIHPALKNISALPRGYWRRVVRYVLSAKTMELGYSILIYNSVNRYYYNIIFYLIHEYISDSVSDLNPFEPHLGHDPNSLNKGIMINYPDLTF